MSWAQRRKAAYIFSTLFVIFLIILFIVLYFLSKQKPTCSDGIQNQGELGVDCGGPCVLLCRSQYYNPSVLWTRWAKVSSAGNYNVLAYAQNPNVGIGAYNVPYNFVIYGRENNKDIILAEKSGSYNIPPITNFVIFESNINLNDKTPTRIEFSMPDTGIAWQKIDNQISGITAVSKTLINEDTEPKLLVTLRNTTIKPISNIESVVILYDGNDNAIAFSKTKTDSIDGGHTADIVYTWPEPFRGKIFRIEVISRII